MSPSRHAAQVLFLLAAALALSLWAPGEIHPLSRLALAGAAAALALTLALSRDGEERDGASPPGGGAANDDGGAAPTRGALGVAVGLAASAALSLHPYRSIHLLASLAGAGAFYLACRRWARPPQAAWLSWFVAASAGVAVWACAQAAGGLEATLEAARVAGADLPGAWRARLLSGRVFGTLLLPAALGGLMAMAVPVAAGLAARARGLRRLPPALAGTLCLGALALSRSYGALAASAAAGLWAAGRLGPARARMARAAVAVVAALAILAFAWARHERTGQRFLEPQGPVVQRLLNWRTALRIAARYPALGCGPGAYASAFVSARREGENDTRFAHNTLLQAVAEAGVWILLPLGYGLGTLAPRLRRGLRGTPLEAGAAVGCVSFLVHNLVDFTAYLPSTLWAALALTAILPGGDGSEPAGATGEERGASLPAPRPAAVRCGWKLVAAGLASICVAALPVICRQVRGESLRDQARAAAVAGAPRPEVDRLYAAAVAADPGGADLRLERAQLLLQGGSERAREALEEARAAARADRGSAVAHFLQSVALAAERDWAEAYVEAAVAVAINPRDPQPRAWLERLEQTLRAPAP